MPSANFFAVIPGRAEGASPESITTGLACDPRVEIDPFRIGPLDQVDLPFAPPLLEFLLPRDRIEDVVVAFKPNKKMNPVSRGESADRVRLVLVRAADQIVGHPDIKSPMLSACEDVNVVHNTTAWGYGFRAPVTQVG